MTVYNECRQFSQKISENCKKIYSIKCKLFMHLKISFDLAKYLLVKKVLIKNVTGFFCLKTSKELQHDKSIIQDHIPYPLNSNLLPLCKSILLCNLLTFHIGYIANLYIEFLDGVMLNCLVQLNKKCLIEPV